MTLLERWDQQQRVGQAFRPIAPDEIRRAIAIAQAADEMASDESFWTVRQMMRRADELLEWKK